MSATGGCLCRNVRYRIIGEPARVGICHCLHCQRQSGSAFSIFAVVRRDAFETEGAYAVYLDTGSSGSVVERLFCPSCGSPIISRIAAQPEMVFVKAGTLDDTSNLAPTVEIWCAFSQNWIIKPPVMLRYSRSVQEGLSEN